jgi:hypothetical protein
MMIKKSALVALVVAISLIFAVPAFAGGPPPKNEDGSRVRVEVYVISQDLVYDSIVGPDLPMKGPFQKLEMVDGQLQTEFGPGDPGYVGGRWWLDLDGNGKMDATDKYFSCPLLGKGHTR